MDKGHRWQELLKRSVSRGKNGLSPIEENRRWVDLSAIARALVYNIVKKHYS
jgi:hypothetical protein